MDSSSPSHGQSSDTVDFDIMVSDDVPSESHEICQKQASPRKINLPSIDPSIPPDYPSISARFRGYHGDTRIFEIRPKKKPKFDLEIKNPVFELSSCKCSISKICDDKYIPLAKEALSYYNAKEHSNLLFVRVSAASSGGLLKRKVHLNVIATSEDGVEKLLFAEVVDGSVRFCCLLQEIESGNPIGWGCAMCRKEVIHPGPRHGYLIAGGDSFEGYPFWGYRFSPRPCNSKPEHHAMYQSCLTKAVRYFTSKHIQSKEFLDPDHFICMDLRGSFTCPCHHKRVVHINFKCITSDPEPQLFFAELEVPNFSVDCGRWDSRKDPFLIVKGCCLLEKVGLGNPFGRYCETCYCSDLIHPGPKDGYRVRAGDDFSDYGFMNIGLGVF